MTKERRLTPDEIELGLSTVAGWSSDGTRLRREYRFADFVDAWAFMSAAALVIQQMDHHPEWSNVYSTVVVELTTHDAGGITRRDLDLARRRETIASRLVRT